MRTGILFGLMAFGTMLLIGCQGVIMPEVSSMASPLAVDSETVDVRLTSTDEMVEGAWSTLRRTPNGISFMVHTNSLTKGDAVTLWFVVFNYPDECMDGCGGDDIVAGRASADLMYGAGKIIGASGNATFAGHRQRGDDSGSFIHDVAPDLSPVGLLNPAGAEVHLVVRTHGQKIPELMPGMIKSFGVACDIDPPRCSNLQFAVHK